MTTTKAFDSTPAALPALQAFFAEHPRVCVLTGAGCSTGSGIPDYRDRNGEWKNRQPVQFADFRGKHSTRQRYWARSLIGWQRFSRAHPNAAHHALARAEQRGLLNGLITQNVDALHQQAGQQQVIDLHGRLDRVICLDCHFDQPRDAFQIRLSKLNADWLHYDAVDAPDGDARLETDFSSFQVPSCPNCGGMLKPDVVFFGENVPRERVAQAMQWSAEADALLVVGSSLMVFSGFRFVREAAKRGQPVAAINHGRTRADELLTLKLEADCGELLQQWAGTLPTATPSLAR
jgi:NAD-dependent SIR2 family protein deacetylase